MNKEPHTFCVCTLQCQTLVGKSFQQQTGYFASTRI